MSENKIKTLGSRFSKRPSRYRIAGKTVKKMGWDQEKTRLLEIGSGDGEAAEYMRRMFDVDVTAVEIDEALVSFSGTRPLEGLRYVCADAADLDCEDESFDAIYAEAFFAACDKPGEVLSECSRVLKSGGFLVVNDFIIHNEVDDDCRNAVSDIPCFSGVHSWRFWKDFMGKYGFEAVEFEEDRDEFISIAAWLSSQYEVSPEDLGKRLSGSDGEFFKLAKMSYGLMIFRKTDREK